ncbi:UNVERIFIED_CONTAM: hypothetical protein K2H54_002345 [Gekko kuhli]
MRLRYKKVVALNATSGHLGPLAPSMRSWITSSQRAETSTLRTVFFRLESEAGEKPRPQPRPTKRHPRSTSPMSLRMIHSHPQAAMQVEQPQHSPSHPPAAMQVALPQLRPSHPPAAIQVALPQLRPSHPPAAIQYIHTSSHAGSNERPVGAVREPEEAMESRDRDPEELPPDVAMADLTAGERSALTKSRKKRVSALQSVGELIATQAREEHREAMRADERRYQEFLREMRSARQAEEDARGRMLAALTESNECTRELTGVLSRLVEAQVAHLEAKRARDQDRRAEAALGAPSGRPASGNYSGIQWQMPPQALPFPPYAGAGAQAQDPLGQQGIVLPMQPPDTHAPAVQAHSSLWSPPPHLARREYSSPESWVPGTPSTQMGTPYQGTRSPFGQSCSATATQHQLIEPPYAGTQHPPTPPPQMGPASQSLLETASRPGSAFHWFHAIEPPRPVDSPAATTQAGPSTAGIVLNPVPQDITPQETEDTAFQMEHGFGVQDPAGGRERAVRIKKRPQPYSP